MIKRFYKKDEMMEFVCGEWGDTITSAPYLVLEDFDLKEKVEQYTKEVHPDHQSSYGCAEYLPRICPVKKLEVAHVHLGSYELEALSPGYFDE